MITVFLFSINCIIIRQLSFCGPIRKFFRRVPHLKIVKYVTCNIIENHRFIIRMLLWKQIFKCCIFLLIKRFLIGPLRIIIALFWWESYFILISKFQKLNEITACYFQTQQKRSNNQAITWKNLIGLTWSDWGVSKTWSDWIGSKKFDPIQSDQVLLTPDFNSKFWEFRGNFHTIQNFCVSRSKLSNIF